MKISDILTSITDESLERMVKYSTACTTENISDLQFMVSLNVWHDGLFTEQCSLSICIVSKSLQRKAMEFDCLTTLYN